MTDDNPYIHEITTADSFEVALGDLLAAASRNGIDPRGAWVYRGQERVPDWEAMIIELEKQAEVD